MTFHKKSIGTLARGFGIKSSLTKIRDLDIFPLSEVVLPHPYLEDHKGHDFEKFGSLVLPKGYVYVALGVLDSRFTDAVPLARVRRLSWSHGTRGHERKTTRPERLLTKDQLTEHGRKNI